MDETVFLNNEVLNQITCAFFKATTYSIVIPTAGGIY